MRIRLFSLAALFVALHAPTSLAQNVHLPSALRRESASAVVTWVLNGREALGLNPEQVAGLTALSNRFGSERGRPTVVALDRVPGKSVPRIIRVKTTASEAFRQALAVLTPEQQAKTVQLLDRSDR